MQATLISAAANRTLRDNRHVPKFASRAAAPEKELTVHHETGDNPRPDMHVDEVILLAGREMLALPVFTEGGRLGPIGNDHRQIEARFYHVCDRHMAPAIWNRGHNFAAIGIDQTRHANANAEDRSSCPCGKLPDATAECFHKIIGGRAEEGACGRGDFAGAKIGQHGLVAILGELDPDHQARLRSEFEHDLAPTATQLLLANLGNEVVGHQLGDRLGHRGLAQPGFADEPGPGGLRMRAE